MDLQLMSKDVRRLSVLAVASLGVITLGQYAQVYLTHILTILVLLFVILIAVIDARRKITDKIDSTYDYIHQIEHLISLTFSIGHSTIPIPKTRGWAGSPDFLKHVVNLVYLSRPRCIVELGSGASSLTTGMCLQNIGSGRLISLDHDIHYAENTRSLVNAAGLGEVCQIMYAPLVDFTIENKVWKWYDFEKADLEERSIDLLVIDGPPTAIQTNSRYPAMPILIDLLSDEAIIILDDADREDEQSTASQWLNEYDELNREYLDFEKGAYVFRFERKNYGVT